MDKEIFNFVSKLIKNQSEEKTYPTKIIVPPYSANDVPDFLSGGVYDQGGQILDSGICNCGGAMYEPPTQDFIELIRKRVIDVAREEEANKDSLDDLVSDALASNRFKHIQKTIDISQKLTEENLKAARKAAKADAKGKIVLPNIKGPSPEYEEPLPATSQEWTLDDIAKSNSPIFSKGSIFIDPNRVKYYKDYGRGYMEYRGDSPTEKEFTVNAIRQTSSRFLEDINDMLNNEEQVDLLDEIVKRVTAPAKTSLDDYYVTIIDDWKALIGNMIENGALKNVNSLPKELRLLIDYETPTFIIKKPHSNVPEIEIQRKVAKGADLYDIVTPFKEIKDYADAYKANYKKILLTKKELDKIEKENSVNYSTVKKLLIPYIEKLPMIGSSLLGIPTGPETPLGQAAQTIKIMAKIAKKTSLTPSEEMYLQKMVGTNQLTNESIAEFANIIDPMKSNIVETSKSKILRPKATKTKKPKPQIPKSQELFDEAPPPPPPLSRSRSEFRPSLAEIGNIKNILSPPKERAVSEKYLKQKAEKEKGKVISYNDVMKELQTKLKGKGLTGKKKYLTKANVSTLLQQVINNFAKKIKSNTPMDYEDFIDTLLFMSK